MDRLSEMQSFVAVVEQGGFTDAARAIGVSKSVVSKNVSSLEARLGARLLNRTTRRVNPTEIGLAYYDRATMVLSKALEADEMVTAMQTDPRGTLRISVPVNFGLSYISPAVGDFLHQYPDVLINMVLDDSFVELVADGYDLAIRIGQMEDSSLKARKLGEARPVLVAAPEYLRKHGTPENLDDLSKHHLLHYTNLSTGNFWRLKTRSGETRDIRVGGRFTANNGEALRRGAEAGLGIALLPTFVLEDRVRSGKLVEVLPESTLGTLGIFAVYPPGRFIQPKLRTFIDFLVQRFKHVGPDDWVCEHIVQGQRKLAETV
jgi:DNA-binding transcriptional LysR family regulator